MEYNFKTMEDFPVIKCQDLAEAETTISIMRTEDIAVIYTSDNTALTKLKKKILANPRDWKITRLYKTAAGEVSGYEITCPKKFISYRLGETEQTEARKAQSAAAAERLKVLRAKRKSKPTV